MVHRRHVGTTVVHEGCWVYAALHVLGWLASALVHAGVLCAIIVLELFRLYCLGVGLLWLLLVCVLVVELLLLLVILERG